MERHRHKELGLERQVAVMVHCQVCSELRPSEATEWPSVLLDRHFPAKEEGLKEVETLAVWIVQDDGMIGHATKLANQPTPLADVGQQSERGDHVEFPVSEW
jgi:hypothetical protein